MTVLGVFLNDEFRSGGHRRYIELMEGMGRNGAEVVVILNSLLGYDPRSFRGVYCEVRYRKGSLPPISWTFKAAATKRARAIAAEGAKPDVVIVFGETHLPAGAALARRFGAPLVYGHRSNTVREWLTYLEEPRRSFAERLRFRAELAKALVDERRIARAANLIVFQSTYDRDDFASRAPASGAKSAVIRGDISGPRFKREYAGANRPGPLHKVAFVGSLGIRKGVDYLIGAIEILASRGLTDLRFEIFGPGERRAELEERLSRSGAGAMARFHGRIADPFPAIAEADLLVVPSLMDSYPNTVLEALHVGTPVVGSRVGGIPDMLGDDDLLFPPMDAGAIADRIERCVREIDFFKRLRSLCQDRAEYFRFDWAREWTKTIEERLCASR